MPGEKILAKKGNMMKKQWGFGLIFSLLTVILISGCSGGTVSIISPTQPVSTQPLPAVLSPTVTAPSPAVTTPSPASTELGPSETPDSTPSIVQAANLKTAQDFIKNSSTFKFDGLGGSLKLVNFTEESPISSFRAAVFTFEFQTAHPGHGDRSGLMLAQAITLHNAEVYIDIDRSEVRLAVCDRTWDMINDKALPVHVSGIVLSGGDTTPAGLMDAPRRFVYQVRKNDGTVVNVGYTAYPPSPAGNAANARVTLDFFAGSIRVGDYLEASGAFNEETNTVVITNQGDFIRTSIPKKEVTGKVLSGGDTTPEGLFDAPRRFVYLIQQADGAIIKVAYTVYPPSPAGNLANQKFSISTYNDGIKPGDYLKAYGNYDLATDAITVSEPGDFLKTYPVKP
jgi:hypothetical protein